MPKILISGYYGFKNFGDETILSILIGHLKQFNSEITVITENPDYTKQKHNVNAIKRFSIKDIISSVKNCDFLISGGGSLLQDVTSLNSLLYYSFILLLGILFNKKIIIFAQGIGPINSFAGKFLVKNILKHCTYVSVRDEKSENLLKKWGIECDLVCDPVYSLEIIKKSPKNEVGVQLRDFSTMNYNLLQKLALFINAKFSNKEVKIFSLQESQDYEICEQFQKIIGGINPNIKTYIVSDNIIENISELGYLIAMRYHAILTGIKSGVKTCAINYDIKVEKLANDAKIPLISMDAHENFEEIYLQLNSLNTEDLVKYSEQNVFNWSNFDKLFFN